ncbi:hypothetical protein A5699_05725 [Mycobacterium sp. E802]|uniref:hypothetical protein n=1 Tax=Mycobacterium sp. E802 TaxID=1834152 RepID=UPI0007FEA8F6|nr:hypothetical protein [Mycobacterium sp. E802]OBG82649.1 hypothetical protein A5699_05725 [Mycobacterium sp. E802]
MYRTKSRFAGRFTVAGLLAVSTAVALPLAPATADAAATVKVRTQKMSAPNLNSAQNGWYDAGTKLTLVCSARGQAVKGYFSFNIPNGGWDNLWYKTSDGSYVADVDIETGTLESVAGDCGATAAPAPAANADRVGRALSWARNQMATNPNGTIQCFEFVEAAYGTKWPGATAMEFYNTLKNQGKIDTGTNPPAGALVFSSDPRFDRGMGHVMLSEGNGKFITANYYKAPKIREVPLTYPGNTYLGWAVAP